jgi:tetratricopeptide (TPR) repeat protein
MSWFDAVRRFLARNSPRRLYALGRRYQLEGRLDEASELYTLLLDTPEDLLKMEPADFTERLFHIGQCHFDAGRFELAESIFRRALSLGIFPITGYLALDTGALLDTLGRFPEARGMYVLAFTAHVMEWGPSSAETTAFLKIFRDRAAAHHADLIFQLKAPCTVELPKHVTR